MATRRGDVRSTDQRQGAAQEEDPSEDHLSPFASQQRSSPAGAAAGKDASALPTLADLLEDPERAALANEAADGLAPLKHSAAGPLHDSGAAGGGTGAQPAEGGGCGGGAAPDYHGAAPGAKRRRRRVIPLKQVVRHSYEYHGLNDLFFFCITAAVVTLVLYWHWGSTTAIFKATVQRTFQGYGNPDWQSQSLANVDTMYDAVEYTMGWMEFWLQRADNVDWANDTVRVGEYGDVKYVRLLVNVERQCSDPFLSPSLECYQDSPTTKQLQAMGYKHLLEWAGWENVGRLAGRDSTNAGRFANWWSYTIVAPKYFGRRATRDDMIGRMYNVTRNTNLNYNNCDLANATCAELNPDATPKCASQGASVPFASWWASSAMCASNRTKDVVSRATRSLVRGSRSFVLNPDVLAQNPEPGTAAVLDLKPFLSKYAYSIALDVLASNAMNGSERTWQSKDADRALFTMLLQRSATAKERPDRILWQITTTVPVRTSFYSQPTDMQRIFMEVLMYICVLIVLGIQAWQICVCKAQSRSLGPWLKHYWNPFELLSNITLVVWVIFYWALYISLKHQDWDFDEWDVVPQGGVDAHKQLDTLSRWSYNYSAWLYMGIVVDFLICLRVARYMRIHVGLKAFYQVFIIAAREFLDFAVFLVFLLVLLGSSVFAFFQLTGGNYQFLRFPDGLALMSRLTFGFLSYEDFQAQALGVGAAVSAVTLLFWLAVLLLVVYTQNIILAIVAEAYEEAKAKLGSADTSFLMLVLMRIVFFLLFVIYRVRMLAADLIGACTGRHGSGGGAFGGPPTPGSAAASSQRFGGSPAGSGQLLGLGSGSTGLGDDGEHSGPAAGAVAAAAASASLNGRLQPGEAPAGGWLRHKQHAQWGRSRRSASAAAADWEVLDPAGAAGGLTSLAPTSSVAELPPDVESGLGSFGALSRGRGLSQAALLPGGGRMSSQAGSLVEELSGSVKDAGAAPAAAAAPDGAAAAAARGASGQLLHAPLSRVKTGVEGGMHGDGRLGGALQRLWHDLILGERHSWRMYKDVSLAPDQRSASWITSWKQRYWRPWCVVRTLPVQCLMNLYQDFAAYKLKEECTWQHLANAHGYQVFSEAFRVDADCIKQQQHSTGAAAVAGAAAAAAAGGAGPDKFTYVGLPLLTDDCYVDEATLSRLFLLTSNLAGELHLLGAPFRRLTAQSVSYVVRAISEVYGVDEEEFEQQQLGVLWAPTAISGAAPPGPGGLPATASVDARDAQLGNVGARKGGGGFIRSLNAKRRDAGPSEQHRQLAWLLHTNRRLEEASNRTSSQMRDLGQRLQQQAAMQLEAQQQQQRTTAALQAQLAALQGSLLAMQPGAAFPGAAGALGSPRVAASSSFGAGATGGMAAMPGAARRLPSLAAAATATSKMLLGGRSRSRTSMPDLADAADMPADQAVALSPSGSGAQPSDSTTAAATEEAGDADTAASGPLVSGQLASLQQQMQQQQAAMQQQQELLRQLLDQMKQQQAR